MLESDLNYHRDKWLSAKAFEVETVMSAGKDLFKAAAPYLPLIEAIIPVASKHSYTFVSDDWYKEWLKSKEFSVKQHNFIIALELLEKAHLASITALMRAKRWADAVCAAYEKENFLSWAASFRGLMESAGDTVDGLLNIPTSLALKHHDITRFLSGYDEVILGAAELERSLDHFVHARWMRIRRADGNVLKAKDNVDYIGGLERVIPNIKPLYHRLCSICHPSNASIEYFYDVGSDGAFTLSPGKDKGAMMAICDEHPDALRDTLMMHCNPPLLILRVLHKFQVHPQLKVLRKFDWTQIKMGQEIEEALRSRRAAS